MRGNYIVRIRFTSVYFNLVIGIMINGHCVRSQTPRAESSYAISAHYYCNQWPLSHTNSYNNIIIYNIIPALLYYNIITYTTLFLSIFIYTTVLLFLFRKKTVSRAQGHALLIVVEVEGYGCRVDVLLINARRRVILRFTVL